MGEGSGDWATVKLTVGVTRDKLRTLVMQFFADTKVGALKVAVRFESVSSLDFPSRQLGTDLARQRC